MKIWGVVGWKNSGKTSVVEGLVRTFADRGLTVATIKHAHHDLSFDRAGTDSQRHQAAGAMETLVGGAGGWALFHSGRAVPDTADDELAGLLARLAPVDLVLVEGFKAASIPKIEVIGPSGGEAPISASVPGVRAYACDGPAPDDRPAFARADHLAQADFIAREVGL